MISIIDYKNKLGTNFKNETMELRIIVLIGIVIQSVLFFISRKLSAIVGFAVTSFILIYGLLAYNSGGGIQIFYIDISQGFFIFLCILWYGFDTYELIISIGTSHKINESLLQKKSVSDFYKYSYDIWRTGTLDGFNDSYKKAASYDYNIFIKANGPFINGAMEAFLAELDPMENEYFFGIGDKKFGKERGFFVLTNYRLFIKEGKGLGYLEIKLSELEEFTSIEGTSNSFLIKLSSGETKEIHNVDVYPTQEAINFGKSISIPPKEK